MEYKPLSGREFPRFSGIKTFFRMPHVGMNSDFDVALLGVPFDTGVSYRPGARFAPSRIREASSLGRGFHWDRRINFFDKLKVADVGDCPTVPVSLEKCYEKIEAYFSELLSYNKKFIAVGGDHSVTLPILRSVRKKYGKPISLIHFDAHLDTYPAAWDCEYHHGSFLRHAIEEGLVDPMSTYQFGIRGPLTGEDDLNYVQDKGVQVFTVDDIREGHINQFTKKLAGFGENPTYITFDIDCLDPAYAPGTGTPVVGGLTTYETQKILRALQIQNLVGCDIVEVSPPFDTSDITAMAAVDTMFEMLCLMS